MELTAMGVHALYLLNNDNVRAKLQALTDRWDSEGREWTMAEALEKAREFAREEGMEV